MLSTLDLTEDELIQLLAKRIQVQELPTFEARPGLNFYVPNEQIAGRLQDEVDSILVSSSLLYNMKISYEFSKADGSAYTFAINISNDHYQLLFSLDNRLNIVEVEYKRYDHRNGMLATIKSGSMDETLSDLEKYTVPGIFKPLNEFRTKVLKIKEKVQRDPNLKNVKFKTRVIRFPKEEAPAIQAVVDRYINAIESKGIELETSERAYDNDTFQTDIYTRSNHKLKKPVGYEPRQSVSLTVSMTLDKQRRLLKYSISSQWFYRDKDLKSRIEAMSFTDALEYLIENLI